LEAKLIGLDGHGDGLLSNGGLKSIDGVSGDSGPGGNVELVGVGAVVDASAICSGVRVAGLSHRVVALVVNKGARLPATVATVAGLNTVNKLLLSEREQVAGLDLPGAFKSGNGGEGPAGTALTLVLDGVDGTGVDPVDTLGEGRNGV
jgi:hypothetical protein